MANIIDYLKWRGDLTLQQSEFNEIDNLILSRFVYFPLEEIMVENEVVLISELGERFKNTNIDKERILQKEDLEMFPLITKSKRFGQMKATKYVSKIDCEAEKQFSAITILMPDDTIYVSYSGTDFSIVGWKEDFNMSFKNHVASQKDALVYLQTISELYKEPIRVGGHSKGGNLAVYASIFAKEDIQNRIINIYNNDGPGFEEDIILTEGYKKIINKVHAFIPEHCIFGKLLNHKEKYTIIKSNQKGIMQHDLFTWKVQGNKFVESEKITYGSEFIDKTIKEWHKKTEPKQREQLVDIIFEIINNTQAETFIEIKNQWLTNTKIILNSYQNMDQKSKDIVLKTMSELFKIGKDNLFEDYQKSKRRNLK